jgi:hypothetical protein
MRTLLLFIASLVLLAGGIFLIVRAEPLATDTKRTPDGGVEAVVDADWQTRLRQIGLGVSVAGTVLLAISASRAIRRSREPLPDVTNPSVT